MDLTFTFLGLQILLPVLLGLSNKPRQFNKVVNNFQNSRFPRNYFNMNSASHSVHSNILPKPISRPEMTFRPTVQFNPPNKPKITKQDLLPSIRPTPFKKPTENAKIPPNLGIRNLQNSAISKIPSRYFDVTNVNVPHTSGFGVQIDDLKSDANRSRDAHDDTNIVILSSNSQNSTPVNSSNDKNDDTPTLDGSNSEDRNIVFNSTITELKSHININLDNVAELKPDDGISKDVEVIEKETIENGKTSKKKSKSIQGVLVILHKALNRTMGNED